MKKWFFAIFLVSLAACQTDAPKVDPDDRALPFFDLKGYFEKEIARLDKDQQRLRKQVSINGKQEVQVLDSLNYERELSVFLNADINRPAWFDKYQVDSLRENGSLRTLTYQAQDSDLRVRTINVRFENGKVSEVIIDKEADNIVAGSGQHLEYRPEQGYRIYSRQKTAISKTQELDISVRFLD